MTRILAMIITAGALAPGLALAQCTSDAECRGGRVCREGKCGAPVCTKDIDCPGNEICEAGACKAAEPPTGAASTPVPAPKVVQPRPSAHPSTDIQAPQSQAPRWSQPPDVPQYIPRSRATEPRTESFAALWEAGIGVTAGSYVLTVLVTAITAQPLVRGISVGDAAIPVFGPWVMLADGRIDTTGYTPAIVIAGLVQLAGVTMIICGLSIQRPVQPAAEISLGAGSHPLRLALAPGLVGEKGVGLRASLINF